MQTTNGPDSANLKADPVETDVAPPLRQLHPRTEGMLQRLAELSGVSPAHALDDSVRRVLKIAEVGAARGSGVFGDPAEHMLNMVHLYFFWALKYALVAIRLTEAEALFIVDVLRGSMFPQAMHAENDPRFLSEEIAEAFEEEDENLVAKWGIDYEAMNDKIRGWSWPQAMAVREAVHRFCAETRAAPETPTLEVLRRVGLVPPDPVVEAFSKVGWRRFPVEELALQPMTHADWRLVAYGEAGAALTARLMGWDVERVLFGEELRLWRDPKTPSLSTPAAPTFATRGRRLDARNLKDVFDAAWLSEARGFILLAAPAAVRLCEEHAGLLTTEWTDDPKAVLAVSVLRQALDEERGVTPPKDRLLEPQCGNDPLRLRQVCFERVERFLRANWPVVERLADALLANTRLTVLTPADVERLIVQP